MLRVTSAANTENSAERLNALRRRGLQLDQFGNGVGPFDYGDPDARSFARQWTKTEHHQSVGTSDGLPVCQQIGEVEVELGAGAQVRRCGAVRQGS